MPAVGARELGGAGVGGVGFGIGNVVVVVAGEIGLGNGKPGGAGSGTAGGSNGGSMLGCSIELMEVSALESSKSIQDIEVHGDGSQGIGVVSTANGASSSSSVSTDGVGFGFLVLGAVSSLKLL